MILYKVFVFGCAVFSLSSPIYNNILIQSVERRSFRNGPDEAGENFVRFYNPLPRFPFSYGMDPMPPGSFERPCIDSNWFFNKTGVNALTAFGIFS
jgi:hypothetical protein